MRGISDRLHFRDVAVGTGGDVLIPHRSQELDEDVHKPGGETSPTPGLEDGGRGYRELIDRTGLGRFTQPEQPPELGERSGNFPLQLFVWKRRMLDSDTPPFQGDEVVVGAFQVREMEKGVLCELDRQLGKKTMSPEIVNERP